MAKYEKGDKVTILETLAKKHRISGDRMIGTCCTECCTATKSMLEYVGKTTTVRHVHIKSMLGYTLDIDNEQWYWSDCMLKPAK